MDSDLKQVRKFDLLKIFQYQRLNQIKNKALDCEISRYQLKFLT